MEYWMTCIDYHGYVFVNDATRGQVMLALKKAGHTCEFDPSFPPSYHCELGHDGGFQGFYLGVWNDGRVKIDMGSKWGSDSVSAKSLAWLARALRAAGFELEWHVRGWAGTSKRLYGPRPANHEKRKLTQGEIEMCEDFARHMGTGIFEDD